MKFPDCTVVSINLPNALLEVIDLYATKRILNRSAYMRELVTEALKDPVHTNTDLPLCEHTDLTPMNEEYLRTPEVDQS